MTLEDSKHWWDRVPDVAKNIVYLGGALGMFAAMWTGLGLPIVVFRGELTSAISVQAAEMEKKLASHASDDSKMFAALSEAANTARKTAETATERSINSLLQNSYTRRDLLRAEDYKIKSNKVPPATDEEARILSIHSQQVRDSLRKVSADICALTNHQECSEPKEP